MSTVTTTGWLTFVSHQTANTSSRDFSQSQARESIFHYLYFLTHRFALNWLCWTNIDSNCLHYVSNWNN